MKTLAFINVDHVIDIITNSSSELFLIKANQEQKVIEDLVKEALPMIGYSFEVRCMEDGTLHEYETESRLDYILSHFAEEHRDEIREKYLSAPRYYAVIIDRDEDSEHDYVPRDNLQALGFELVDSDY